MAPKKPITNQDVASSVAKDSIVQTVADVQGVELLSKSTCGGSGWAKGQPVYWDGKHKCATAIKGKGFKCIGVGYEDAGDSIYEAKVRMKNQTQRSDVNGND